MRSRRLLNVDCPSALGYRPTDMRSHPWLPPSRQLTAKIARAQATAVLRQLAYLPTAALGARAAGLPALMSALPNLLRTDPGLVLDAAARADVLPAPRA